MTLIGERSSAQLKNYLHLRKTAPALLQLAASEAAVQRFDSALDKVNAALSLDPRLFPVAGDKMITNRRRPILTLTEDNSPGRHDTLIAPCDNERYGLLGCTHYHDNCRDNLHAGLAALGITIPYTPDSLNLFMNIPWRQDGALEWGNCLCKPGDSVVFKAEMDAIIAYSACPQDMLPINNGVTTEAHYEILTG